MMSDDAKDMSVPMDLEDRLEELLTPIPKVWLRITDKQTGGLLFERPYKDIEINIYTDKEQ